MYKIFTSLVALCCCLSFARTATAQLSFSVVPTDLETDIQVGDMVTVNVEVSEFYDVASYQFSINWNSSWLTFVELDSLNLPNMSQGGNFGLNQVGSGIITHLWSAPGGPPYNGFYSAFDGDTTIFNMKFIVATTEGITAPISITGSPTGLEVVGNDGSGNLAEITGSTVINNGTATEDPDGGGGGGGGPACEFGGAFGQIIEDGTGDTGDEVCLTVYACGFTDIVTAQYSLGFDPALLQFSNTANYNLPGLVGGFFNSDNTAGWVTFSWLEEFGNGVTVADGDPLYDICFTIVGAGGNTADVDFTNTPLGIEVTDTNSGGAPIPFNGDASEVTITGTGTSAVTVVASNTQATVGSQTCVEVTTLNFDDILGVQYSMHWDPTILEYVSLGSFAPFLTAGLFNATPAFTDAGMMVLSYSGSGVSLGNGETLYEVCFDVIGEIGETSPFSFDGTPLSVEVTQEINGTDQMVPLTTQAGEVEVVAGGGGNDPLNLIIQNAETCPGAIGMPDTVYVDIVAANFDSIHSLQYDVTYDPVALTYLGGAIDLTPDLQSAQFSSPSSGSIRIVWVEGSVLPISFATDTLLYRLCFLVNAADGTNVDISFDQGAVIEIGSPTTPNGEITDATFTNGTVTVTNSACDNNGPVITIDNTTHVDCFGDNTGAINISVTGGTMPYTYNWATSSNPSDEDQAGLTANSYTVIVTDADGATGTQSVTITQPAAALSTPMTSTDATCFGSADGTATVTPAGGTAPYNTTYAWSANANGQTGSTITGLSAGEYCVTVTDANGCTENDCITIDEGNEIDISIDATDSNCTSPSGTLEANPSGGAGAPYTYSWNTGPAQTTKIATGLMAGNYCVTVTDSDGCTAEQCGVVNTLSDLSVSIDNTQETTCDESADGILTATATNLTGTATYTWSSNTGNQTANVLADLPVGDYDVTLTDSGTGCQAAASGTVDSADDGISVSVADGEASCDDASDGTLTAVPSGAASGSTPTYLWSNGETTQTITGLVPDDYEVTITDPVTNCTDVATATVDAGDGVEVTIDDAQVSCIGDSDGILEAEVSNESGTVTYLWSNNNETTPVITGLAVGSYTVTVTDMSSGCTDTHTATVDNPDAMTAATSVSSDYNGADISCPGTTDGIATVDADGGTGPYGYAWSAGSNPTAMTVIGLTAGTHTVTVTDNNGCSITQTVTLNAPSMMSLSANVTDEDAGADGEIDLSVSGGTVVTGYTYTWSPGGATTQDISGLTAGEYCVTVSDNNGCTNTGCYTVNSPGALDVNLSSITPESCYESADGVIAITHSGVGPFTYTWSPATVSGTQSPFTGVGQGSYSVTVADVNGVTGVLSSIIVAGPVTQISNTSDVSHVDCFGNSTGSIGLTVSGGNGPIYNATWGGGITDGLSITDLPAGNYTPTITDNNGCTFAGATITVNEPPVMDVELASTVNPGCNGGLTGEITLNVSGGTPMYTYTWNGLPGGSTTTTVPVLTGLGAGSYTCVVTDDNGCLAATGQIVLDMVGSPVVTIDSQNNLSCFEDMSGSISITASGGMADYSYEWSDLTGSTDDPEDRTDLPVGVYTVTVTDANGCSAIEGPITITQPGEIVLSANFVTPATAAGGNGGIDMNDIVGGTGPFTYIWTDENNVQIATTLDVVGLDLGTYCLLVTDTNGGCTAETCVNVEGDFQIPTSCVVETPESCAGAEDAAIDICIFGGQEPYTYLWSNGEITEDLANLGPGEYCVTVTEATGLTITECWTLGGAELLVISNFNINHETGNGCNGSIGITVAGGNAPYTYVWSNTFIGEDPSMLCKGSYTVTVTDDNGCMLISPQLDIFPPPITIANTSMEMASCAGVSDGSVCVTLFGGCDPYSLVLASDSTINQNSITGELICFEDLPAGTDTLIISDADGSTNTPDIMIPFTITEPDPVVVDTISVINNTGGDVCNGSINIEVEGGTPGYTYLWSHGPMSEDVDMLCGEINGADPYSVTVTDANGCTGVFENIEIEDVPVVTGAITNVSCFGGSDGTITTEVNFGTPSYTYMWSTGETSTGISSLEAGVYTLTVTDAASITTVETFTVEAPPSLLEVEVVSVDVPNGNNADGCINIGVTGGWGNYEYLWSNGATTMDVCGLVGGPPEDPICYTVTVTDANGEGCAVFETDCLVAEDIYKVDEEIGLETCFDDNDGFICIETEGGLAPHAYQWSGGLGTDNCILGIGSGHYEVTVTDATGFLIKVFEWDLEGPDPLGVSFSTGPGIATAFAVGGTAPYIYAWNGYSENKDSILGPVQTGEYEVAVIDSHGCTVNDQVEVIGDQDGECSEARTILTPNGDSKNEEFIILCARTYDINLEVFNRWGEKVYEAENYDNSWTARDDAGNPLPEGGYYYVIKYTNPDGDDKQVKGYVTILADRN